MHVLTATNTSTPCGRYTPNTFSFLLLPVPGFSLAGPDSKSLLRIQRQIHASETGEKNCVIPGTRAKPLQYPCLYVRFFDVFCLTTPIITISIPVPCNCQQNLVGRMIRFTMSGLWPLTFSSRHMQSHAPQDPGKISSPSQAAALCCLFMISWILMISQLSFELMMMMKLLLMIHVFLYMSCCN